MLSNAVLQKIFADHAKNPGHFTKPNQNIKHAMPGVVSAAAGMPDPWDWEPEEEKTRKFNVQKSESPVWKELKPYRGKTRTNGLRNNKREYYQWDHTHNDIEVYDHSKMHLGSLDPKNGQMYKGPKPRRALKW